MGRPDYALAEKVEVQVYELAEGQTVETEVPAGSGMAIAGTIRAEKKAGEFTVSVVNGDAGLTAVSFFATGQAWKSSVADGQKQVALKL